MEKLTRGEDNRLRLRKDMRSKLELRQNAQTRGRRTGNHRERHKIVTLRSEAAQNWLIFVRGGLQC